MTETRDVATLRGFGATTYWLYCEPVNFAIALKSAGLNATHVEIFNCSPSKAQSLAADPRPHGFWTLDKFRPQLKRPLNNFLAAMQERDITTVVTLYGGHNMTGVTDASCAEILTWLNARPQGINNIILNLAAEPPNKAADPSRAVFLRLTQILDRMWRGAKLWNLGTCPKTAPSGYSIEWHAQKITDYGPPASQKKTYVLTDSHVWHELNRTHLPEQSFANKTDPVKLVPFALECWRRGHGFIEYGQRFRSWQDYDLEGMRAVATGTRVYSERSEA